MLLQCRKANSTSLFSRKLLTSITSSSLLIPVEIISGLPVFDRISSKGKFVRSADATLYALTPKDSKTSMLFSSQGVHIYKIPFPWQYSEIFRCSSTENSNLFKRSIIYSVPKSSPDLFKDFSL